MAFIPSDLSGSTTSSDKNYFEVSIPNLDVNTSYDIQFAWKYADGTLSGPSAKKTVVTANESQLSKPKFLSTDLVSSSNSLIVKWSGVDYLGNTYPSNFDYVEIWVKGGIFGSSYVLFGQRFKAAGSYTLTSQTGIYYVKLRAVSKLKNYSDYSDEQTATTVAPLTVDNIGPDAPSGGTVTAGIDNSEGATIGFNAYLDISWNAVSDSTLRGYRIRFRENGTSDPYSYVDSPGTGTTFRLNGLSIGTTYQVAIASYDELNNTSSAYTSIGTAVASGTPFIGKNITTVGYFGASATGDTGTFKFGYGIQPSGGTKRGLWFNDHNYWYIDSSQSASLKLGGSTNNYLSWDGSDFKIDGNLIARQGTFNGNVSIASGGSLYSGTLTGETTTSGSKTGGTLTGTGFILNSDGLEFKYDGTVMTQINALTGTIYAEDGIFNGEINASSGTIGGANGWTIQSGFLQSLGGYIDLGSDGYIDMSLGGIIDMGSLGSIVMGNFVIQESGGYFSIFENGKDIIAVSGADDGTNGRVIIGDSSGRQAQVGKSAQIAGGTENSLSGGLRNMFTIVESVWNSTGASIYSSAVAGDVLLVYDPTVL